MKTAQPVATIATVVEAVTIAGQAGVAKGKVVDAVMKETGCCRAYAYKLVGKAQAKKAILRRKEDKLYVVPSR